MTGFAEDDRRRFEHLAREYLEHPCYQLMKGFIQHGSVSTYAHCVRVAQTSFAWARALKLPVDEHDLVAGALLHDFYLYDWHDRSTSRPHHATRHPLYACENASECFSLPPRVENIIESHMWPLPPTRVPRSLEAVLVCAADKWCSLGETLHARGARRARGAAPVTTNRSVSR